MRVKNVYRDATVIDVMVGGHWFSVLPGSWIVDLRGPYRHAGWLNTERNRYSAFISHVQMVRHRRLRVAARRKNAA